jgi:hypothetical protein
MLALLFVLALAVRTFRAVQEPVINPDAIRFIKQAQLLPVNPLGAIRTEIYHPLHSVASLLAHGVISPFFENDRTAWLASVKFVGILAGSIVALQIVALARRLGAPFWSGVAAALVWIFGRRTSVYGADGLSDMLFLSLFAASILTAIRAMRRRSSFDYILLFLSGLLAGLAYLTRPEGLFAPILVVAAVLFGVQPSGCFPLKNRLKPVLRTALALFLGTALPALPYMFAIGSVTRKEAKFVTDFPQDQVSARTISLAAVPAKIIKELWETFGFAPFLIVAITFLLSIVVAKQLWIRPRLRPLVLTWLVTWTLVMAIVARRLGYLDGRHTLILIFLLHALLALAFFAVSRALHYWIGRRAPHLPSVATAILVLLAILPGIQQLRVPPRGDKRFIRDAADWVAAHVPSDTIVCDHEQLVGYYSGHSYARWLGTPADPRLETLASLRTPAHHHLLLAYHYFPSQGDSARSPRPAIGPYQQLISFPSGKGETVTLYDLPEDR